MGQIPIRVGGMIVPAPRHLESREGTFTLSAANTLHAAEPAQPAANALRRDLGRATGFTFPAADSAGDAAIAITVDPVHLPPQAYTLTVSPDRIEITGGDPAGAFYAVQSLRQLLPAEIFATDVVDRTWPIPCVVIEDRPEFGWRGTMLDVTRHFFDKAYVLRLIDLLALHRLNVLHLHLTDDQGWRLDIPGYPKLAEISAWRSETLVGHGRTPEAERTYNGQPHGGYYTADDVREIVAYAAERFVMVLPEIDMPGHMQSVVAAYPELGNTGDQVEVRKHWGISTHVLGIHDEALQFCRDVLTEVLNLFPAAFVHCGGDEVPKVEWRESERAQTKLRELGLANEEELQTWFTKTMAAFLAGAGRRFVGWDEVLDGAGAAALSEDVVVMSWRSEQGGVAAAKAGRDVVMAPSSHLYFDHGQAENADTEPLSIGGYIPLAKVYAYEPIPAELRSDPAAISHVLGAQCQLWTEYVPTPEHADYMLFPRVCAFAEAVWRERAGSYDDFLERMRTHAGRLDALGVNYRPLD